MIKTANDIADIVLTKLANLNGGLGITGGVVDELRKPASEYTQNAIMAGAGLGAVGGALLGNGMGPAGKLVGGIAGTAIGGMAGNVGGKTHDFIEGQKTATQGDNENQVQEAPTPVPEGMSDYARSIQAWYQAHPEYAPPPKTAEDDRSMTGGGSALALGIGGGLGAGAGYGFHMKSKAGDLADAYAHRQKVLNTVYDKIEMPARGQRYLNAISPTEAQFGKGEVFKKIRKRMVPKRLGIAAAAGAGLGLGAYGLSRTSGGGEKEAADSILEPAIGTSLVLGGGAAGAGVIGTGIQSMKLEDDLAKAHAKYRPNIPASTYSSSDAFKKIRVDKLHNRLLLGGAIGAGLGGLGYGAYRAATQD